MRDGSGEHSDGLGLRAWVVWMLLGLVFVGSVVGNAWIGEGGALLVRVATVVEIVTNSGWMPVVYVVGAWGYGWALWRGTGAMGWVGRIGIGLAVMLSLTHGLGVLGILNEVSAWVVSGVGLGLAFVGIARDWAEIERGVRGWGKIDRVSGVFAAVFLVGVGLLVVAACNPAGVLWDSEYGNYDSLSYHLELPRVWMEGGRVWPVDFNVYSYLPSYVEAAQVHMGVLGGLGGLGGDGMGLASGDGNGIYAAQLLSVIFAVLAALVSGSVTERACGLLGLGEGAGRVGGWIARVLVLTTPWMVVVGTISYTEPAVVLLTMCGIGIALETEWSVMRRVVGTAVVMGVACSCKPTALFLAVPMVGVVLLSLVSVKDWWRVFLVGGVVGFVVLLPWLVRNEMATGNPVFPMMSGVFGEGHWDAGQHARYAAAHSFDGSWIERVKLLVVPDENGTTHVSRYRGLTNMQWGVTPAMGMLGLVVLVMYRKTRRAGVVCVVGVGMVLVAWMGLTHVQSRFLVPMVGVFGVLGGVGVAVVSDWARDLLGKITLFGAVVVLACVPVVVLIGQFGGQAGGHPNGLLVAGGGAFTGEVGFGSFDQMLWWGGVNHAADDGLGVYLIGDGAVVYVRSPVVYNTTYDGWLIGELMREMPGDFGGWEEELVERGIGWVVINFSEIRRFNESGWADPDVTVEAMVLWVGSLGEPRMVWDNGRRMMFRIDSSGGENRADEGSP